MPTAQQARPNWLIRRAFPKQFRFNLATMPVRTRPRKRACGRPHAHHAPSPWISKCDDFETAKPRIGKAVRFNRQRRRHDTVETLESEPVNDEIPAPCTPSIFTTLEAELEQDIEVFGMRGCFGPGMPLSDDWVPPSIQHGCFPPSILHGCSPPSTQHGSSSCNVQITTRFQNNSVGSIEVAVEWLPDSSQDNHSHNSIGEFQSAAHTDLAAAISAFLSTHVL